jgi:Ca2+-binding RTX toxin-like protein
MANVVGSNKADLLYGTMGDDTISARGGNDTIVWSLGADHIDGGAGSDTMDYSGYKGELSIVLTGSTETAVMVNGEPGDVLVNIENLIGGGRNDYFVGDDADNTFHGNGGHDYFVASQGADAYYGGSGYDAVDYSNVGTALTIRIRPTGYGYAMTTDQSNNYDRLYSIENITGTQFGDHISGSGANNYFRGMGGDDMLSGGAGGDVLDGGQGNDRLKGGANADIFQFSGELGKDVVVDFHTEGDSHDFIDLSATTVSDFDDLMKNHATQQGDDVVIDTLGHGTITLKHVDINNLTADQFIF